MLTISDDVDIHDPASTSLHAVAGCQAPGLAAKSSAPAASQFEPMRAELMRASFSIAGGTAGDARSAEALRGEAAIDRDHLRIRAPPSGTSGEGRVAQL